MNQILDKLPEDLQRRPVEKPSTFEPRPSRVELIARGRAMRKSCPRGSHKAWSAPDDRPDPLLLIEEANVGRIPELIPLRHGRMLASPFTFYRGTALNMAVDLAGTPTTGFRVQACGDAHLGNFRCFATPERRIIFDIHDLDETLPAPWEWDVKRLAVSFSQAHAIGQRHLSRLDARHQRPAFLRPSVAGHETQVPHRRIQAGQDGHLRQLVRSHAGAPHARSGEPALISGYLGKADTFDQAIADFAVTYAAQVERDYEYFAQAVRDGKIAATIDDGA